MRVIYLVHDLDDATGWGRFSKELVTRFIDRDIEVHIFTEHPSGFPGEQVVLKRSFGALTSVPALRKYIKKHKIDIVHSFELNPYAITANLATMGLKAKHVITATGAYSVRPLYQPITKYFASSAYRNADQVLCISKYIEDEIKKCVPLNNTSVVTLGVDQEKFSGPRTEAETPFILSVGNVGPRKGYYVSVDAFAEVAKKVPDLKYLIAGSITENAKKNFSNKLKSLGIEDRVEFLGSLNDKELKKLYLSAKLFLLAAINVDHHFEGFGLVFLEAASAGLPVIGTLDNGIKDAIQDGKNGFLVPQNDVEATAKAIYQIIEDRSRWSKMSEASLSWAKENSWHNTVDKYIDLYKEVVIN